MTKKKKKTRKRRKKVKPKRAITCSNCGGADHNARSCKQDAQPPGRHLLPHEAYRNGTYWAPFGNKGWSAVTITKLGRLHARVERVNPKTQEVIAKGKVRMDELLKRDPKKIGIDKPKDTPDVMFAEYREQRAAVEAKEVAQKMERAQREWEAEETETPEPEPELTPEEKAARQERLSALLDQLGDDTDSDW